MFKKMMMIGLLLTSAVYAEESISLKFSELQKKATDAIIAQYASEFETEIAASDVFEFSLESVDENTVTLSAGAPSTDPEDESMPNYCEVVLKRATKYKKYEVTEVGCSKYDK